jgi:hypothetical protein
MKSGSLCDICHDREATDWDHDHETDLLRGRLCRRCNNAVGIIENFNLTEAVLSYLENPPRSDGGTYHAMRLTMQKNTPSRDPAYRALFARQRYAAGYRAPSRLVDEVR